MSIFLRIYQSHQRLVKRIHSFRIPLSPTGQKIAGFIYFIIPIIGGITLLNT